MVNNETNMSQKDPFTVFKGFHVQHVKAHSKDKTVPELKRQGKLTQWTENTPWD